MTEMAGFTFGSSGLRMVLPFGAVQSLPNPDLFRPHTRVTPPAAQVSCRVSLNGHSGGVRALRSFSSICRPRPFSEGPTKTEEPATERKQNAYLNLLKNDRRHRENPLLTRTARRLYDLRRFRRANHELSIYAAHD